MFLLYQSLPVWWSLFSSSSCLLSSDWWAVMGLTFNSLLLLIFYIFISNTGSQWQATGEWRCTKWGFHFWATCIWNGSSGMLYIYFCFLAFYLYIVVFWTFLLFVDITVLQYYFGLLSCVTKIICWSPCCMVRAFTKLRTCCITIIYIMVIIIGKISCMMHPIRSLIPSDWLKLWSHNIWVFLFR